MKPFLIFPLLGLSGFGALGQGPGPQIQAISQAADPNDSLIRNAFARQGIRITAAEAASIRPNVFLMVPSEKIKIHVKEGGRTLERTLPERLRELGLTSQARDRNVIVSNQFAIVPVPSWSMTGAGGRSNGKGGAPPRAAFNFSIFPYGSTNFVITDVIEGSSEAIVGPGTHQMLYANIHGKKAPFTASRAEDRQDLLRLEKELKAKGMDVDVQRYYLIQIPLRRDAKARPSNLGTPPMARAFGNLASPSIANVAGGVMNDVVVMSPPPSAPDMYPGGTACSFRSLRPPRSPHLLVGGPAHEV